MTSFDKTRSVIQRVSYFKRQLLLLAIFLIPTAFFLLRLLAVIEEIRALEITYTVKIPYTMMIAWSFLACMGGVSSLWSFSMFYGMFAFTLPLKRNSWKKKIKRKISMYMKGMMSILSTMSSIISLL